MAKAQPVFADPAELLSLAQVAELLHRRDDEVARLVATRAIPSMDASRGRKVVPRWALIEWQRRQVEEGR
jgi:hypothetical protein